MPKSERFKKIDHGKVGRMSKQKMKETMNLNNKAQLIMYYKQYPQQFYKANKPELLAHNAQMEKSYVGTFNAVRQKITSAAQSRSNLNISGYLQKQDRKNATSNHTRSSAFSKVTLQSVHKKVYEPVDGKTLSPKLDGRKRISNLTIK